MARISGNRSHSRGFNLAFIFSMSFTLLSFQLWTLRSLTTQTNSKDFEIELGTNAQGSPHENDKNAPFPLSSLPPQFQNIGAKMPHHQEFRPLSCCGVDYLRTSLEWNKTTCSPTEEVFAWLMNQVNFRNLTMMLAYGELIHILRDHALLRVDGSYYDDDFDTMVTPSTFQIILKLEPYLWSRFGWSIRVFYGCSDKNKRTNNAVFAQILSVCGHEYIKVRNKVVAMYPAIEMYIVQSIPDGLVRDNWQGSVFPESWLFPSKPFSIEIGTSGFNKTLNLQIPAQPEQILDCLYGNWHVYSKAHSPQGSRCENEE